MKQILTAQEREAKRARQAEEQRIAALCEDYVGQLTRAGWTNAKAERKAIFFAISGDDPYGVNRSAVDEDGQNAVDHLISVGVAPKGWGYVAPEPALAEDPAAPPEVFSEPEPNPLQEENDRLKARIAELEQAAANVANQAEAALNTLSTNAHSVEGGDGVSSVDDLAPAEAKPDDGIPDAFRGLMLDEESAAKFTERMRRRWQYLKHLQMDGSKPRDARALPDMTEEESIELADLEERNKQSGGTRWLE